MLRSTSTSPPLLSDDHLLAEDAQTLPEIEEPIAAIEACLPRLREIARGFGNLTLSFLPPMWEDANGVRGSYNCYIHKVYGIQKTTHREDELPHPSTFGVLQSRPDRPIVKPDEAAQEAFFLQHKLASLSASVGPERADGFVGHIFSGMLPVASTGPLQYATTRICKDAGINLSKDYLQLYMLDQRSVRNFYDQLRETLDIFHASGMVNRDIKPGNLVIGGAKARMIDFEFGAFDSSGFIGTHRYASPQLLARSLDRDKSDTTAISFETLKFYDEWSMGATLLEMLLPYHLGSTTTKKNTTGNYNEQILGLYDRFYGVYYALVFRKKGDTFKIPEKLLRCFPGLPDHFVMIMGKIRGQIKGWGSLGSDLDFNNLSVCDDAAVAHVWKKFLDYFIPTLFEQREEFIKKHNKKYREKLSLDDGNFKQEMADILYQQLRFNEQAPRVSFACSSVSARSVGSSSTSTGTRASSQDSDNTAYSLSSALLLADSVHSDGARRAASSATVPRSRKSTVAEQEAALAAILSEDFARKRYHEFPRGVKILEEETEEARRERIEACTYDANTWVRLPQDLVEELPNGTERFEEVAPAARMPNMPFERLMDVLFGLIGDKDEGWKKNIKDDEESFECDQLSLYFSLLRGHVKNKVGTKVTVKEAKAHEGIVERITTAYVLMAESSWYITSSIQAAKDALDEDPLDSHLALILKVREEVKASFQALVDNARPELRDIVNNLGLTPALKQSVEGAARRAKEAIESNEEYVNSPGKPSPVPYQDAILGLDAFVEDPNPLGSPAAESWQRRVYLVKGFSCVFSSAVPRAIEPLTHEFLKKLFHFIHQIKAVDVEKSRALMDVFIQRVIACFGDKLNQPGKMTIRAFFTENAGEKESLSLEKRFENINNEISDKEKWALRRIHSDINKLMSAPCAAENLALSDDSARTFHFVVKTAVASKNRMRHFYSNYHRGDEARRINGVDIYDTEEERVRYSEQLSGMGGGF